MTLPRKIEKPTKFPRPKRERKRRTITYCAGHRAWIRTHACCVPDCSALPIVCAHVRKGTNGGTGMKPDDRWTISLCWAHHDEQGNIGEPAFERKYGIDMKALAREFAAKSKFRSKWK